MISHRLEVVRAADHVVVIDGARVVDSGTPAGTQQPRRPIPANSSASTRDVVMSDTITIDVAQLAGQTGRGVRIAVIDSGVHASHPHIGGLVEGASVARRRLRSQSGVDDRLGHGTAVAAAIHEKAPGAAIIPVRVFDRELTATIDALVSAIHGRPGVGASLINLSLGTLNPRTCRQAARCDRRCRERRCGGRRRGSRSRSSVAARGAGWCRRGRAGLGVSA